MRNFSFGTALFIRLGTNQAVDEDSFGAYEEDVTVTGDAVQYTPARVNGDPDDCHEAEGGYVEDISVTRDSDGKEIDVPDSMMEDLEEEADQSLADEADNAAEDAAEARYEAMREASEDDREEDYASYEDY